jgi:alpha-beta hydrolase superfamily lysophospholipase
LVVEFDVLGMPYEQRRIILVPDDEGEVVATLVARRASAPTTRAVLYLHGFVDYFFQTHLADFFVERGWDFYALDLRKYGRSWLPHQTANFARSMAEYFPEIDAAVRIIREEDGHDTLLVNGHSTGGLIAALWAHRVRGQGLLQGLFLNSPFLEFNEPWIVRKGLTPLVSVVGAIRPYAAMPQELGKTYGASLHRDHHGEWDYDLTWKPLNGYKIHAGWVRAISQAHKRAQAGLAIDVPVLVASSAKSYRGDFSEEAHHADSVLNVEHIARYAPGLGADVTLVQIEGGKHDLTLSRAQARERMFTVLGGWLTDTLDTPSSGETNTATLA